MKGSSSRWDCLRDNDKSLSLPSKPTTLRGDSKIGTGSYPERNRQHPSSKLGGNDLANRSWRSNALSHSSSSITTKETKIRDAINNLRSQTQRKHQCDNDIWKCMDEISNLFLVKPDQSRSPGQKEDTSTHQSPIPLFLLWDAADFTIQCLRLPEQPIPCDLAKKISDTAAATLQLSSGYIRHSLGASDKNESFQRPRSMTDLRLCECASIILDLLTNRDQLSNSDDTTTLIECKESLFACLANILELSATLGLSESSSKNRRSLLFPWGAEKTVNLVVMQSVLPFVNATMKDTSISHCTKVTRCFPAMKCLYLLMRDSSADKQPSIHQLSKHAAAMLAPLIIDVDLNGKEKERPNPLRSSTLQAIVAFWDCLYQLTQENQSTSMDVIEVGCQCLTVALQSLQALKRGKTYHSVSEAPPIELDIATICSQIQIAFQKELFCSHTSLLPELLASLCQTYPNATASQWHLFLEQSAHQPEKSSSNAPLLPKFIEEGSVAIIDKQFNDNSIMILPAAIRTTLMLVSAMPFSHWIGEGSKSKTRLSGANYFASRIRNAMIRLIDCTYNMMTSISDVVADVQSERLAPSQLIYSIMIHTSQLAAKLCSALLFTGQNSMLLLPASKLVSCSGQIVVSCFRAMSDSSSHCAKFYEQTVEIFSHVIADTVDVELNQTVSPAQYWLSDSASYEFIGFLLSQKSPPLERERMAILCRVARTCPWALVREPFNLASFCEICSIQSKPRNGPDCKLSGVKLIESFLSGRRVYSAEFAAIDTSPAIVDTIFPILCSSLKDREAKVRAAAVASFAFICEAEWFMLLHSQSDEKPDLDWQCIESIFRLCSKKYGENNSKVRSSACKAIGEICTCIITPRCTKDVTAALSRKVCHEMVDALTDESSVRSMCLFAIGNMASALKEQNHDRETHIALLPSLNCLFSSVSACLDDKDEKVVVNAIRAVGQLSYFIYSSDFYTPEPSTTLDLYHNVLSNLTQKVKCGTDLVVEGMSTDVSSNQRNTAKKHAWGSCSTIRMLLGYRELWQHHDAKLIQSVLFEQFRCLQLSNELHDKIVAAAITSLVSLPVSFWQLLPKECDSIGRGLASCFCHFSNSKQMVPTPSYHDEISILTKTLLVAAKSQDFCHAFILRDDLNFSVDFLYQWLVSNNVSFEVMEEITTAIQTPEVQQFIDVSSVQMFISRTAHQVKESNSPSKSVKDDEAQDEDEI